MPEAASAQATEAPATPKTVHVVFQPIGVGFDVPYNETLFECALQVGVEVDTACGGNGTCGKCKVKFEHAAPPFKPIDCAHLTGGEIQAGYRLSCQIEAVQDMVVYVPPAGSRAQVKILHQGVQRDVPLQPNVLKIFVPYVNPRRRSGTADWDFVRANLPRWFQGVHLPLHWLRQLPDYLRREAGLTLTVAGRQEVIRLEEGDTTAHNYGVAVDIGSTTVVCFLIDLNTGAEVGAASGLNKQTVYGDDIIARLSRTQYNADGLAQMHRLIVEQLNELLGQLAAAAEIELRQVYEVTVVGNMAMHHFLLRLDSTYLGLSPYAPVFRDGVAVTAGELGLALEPDVPVYLLPNIAGFVGSDTVAVILAGEMHTADGLILAADVGTNGEVALGSRARLVACSAPAGPAFEGARIKQGMRAAAGAIDHVVIEQTVEFTVVGGGPPKGICGSALIDITAGLLRAGLVDFTGKLRLPEELPPGAPDELRSRIVVTDDRRKNYFVLAWPGEAGAEQEIFFTQQDLREFQLAKGAIRAGQMVLQRYLEAGDDDLEMVMLAGAFGAYIDLPNARQVNLVPQVPDDRLRSVGNAAGVGAKLALVSVRERTAAGKIGRRTEHVQLSGLPEFQRAFTHAMRFPKS